MLNHITIMGRLVRDPELRRTGSGVAVTSFTVAVDRDFGKNENGERETDFIDCVAWRQTGEFVSKYFAKGRMAVVSVPGRIRTATSVALQKSLQTMSTSATASVMAKAAVSPLLQPTTSAATPLPQLPAPHLTLQCWMMTTHSCLSKVAST